MAVFSIDCMVRRGDLLVMSRLGDASIGGRTHEYLAQYHTGNRSVSAVHPS